jgi:hypothetical protein
MRKKFRVFDMMHPSYQVEDLLMADLKNPERAVVLATVHESDKYLRTWVQDQMIYMDNEDIRKYGFYLISNKKAYDVFIKKPNTIHVDAWLREQQRIIRNRRYERFKKFLPAVQEIRIKKGLLEVNSLRECHRYNTPHRYIERMEDLLDDGIQNKAVNDVLSYNVRVYTTRLPVVTSPRTRDVNTRWDKYIHRFYPEFIDGRYGLYDFKDPNPALKALLHADMDSEAQSALVWCLNNHN